MLNFKNVNIIAGVILIILIIFNFSYLYFLLLLILLIAFYAYGSANIRSGFYIPAFCSGNPGSKKIAVTFDDGPDANYTQAILDILKKNQIQATFFCVGKKIPGNEDILKRIVNDGHLIGNHTYSHSWKLDFSTVSRIKNDILQTEDLILKTTGAKTFLFRPPFGVTNPHIAKATKKLNYTMTGWGLRTFDTSRKKEQVIDKIRNNIKDGDIILLHDNNPEIPAILNGIINFVHDKGFRFVRVDKLPGFDKHK